VAEAKHSPSGKIETKLLTVLQKVHSSRAMANQPCSRHGRNFSQLDWLLQTAVRNHASCNEQTGQ
jgi:hypothetical protein